MASTALSRRLMVAVALLAGGMAGGLLWAQDREEREGRESRREFRGGDSRGGEGGERPRFGGSGGPGGRGGTEEMLRNLDLNKNGMLDPNEMEGPAKFFVPRLASEAGLDPSQPMAIDQLIAAREKMRASGGSPFGGGPGGGPGGGFAPGGPMGPGGSERGREDRDREKDREKDRDRESRSGESSNSGSRSQAAEKPLVPGFGEDMTIASVPGFGGPEGPVAGLGGRDKAEEYASDLLKRYDKNKDGAIDSEEWKDGRWSPEPTESDTNRDGKLTRDELLARYARKNPPKSASTSGGSSSSTAAPMGGDGSSADPDGKLLRFAESMMSRYDENKDGILQKEEWSNMRGDPAAADKNKDGLITKEELAERLASYGGGGPGSGGPGGGGPGGGWGGGREGRDGGGREGGGGGGFGSSGASSKGSTKTTGGKVYKFTSPTARLPKGIPTWFTRNDANGDGQIVMSEFSTTWSDSKVSEFNKYDINGDGLITPDEVLEADKKKS